MPPHDVDLMNEAMVPPVNAEPALSERHDRRVTVTAAPAAAPKPGQF
jgi:hypothetical protein